jgi:hypothetical protein
MKDKDLHDLIIQVAIELSAADFPNIWRCRRAPREWWESLTTSDEWLNIHRDGQRLEISASHPKEMTSAYNAPSITVSATRTPQAIARDILSRLAPDARAHYAKCHEATRKAKEAREAHAATLHKLQNYCKWKRTDSNGQRTEWTAENVRADISNTRVYDLRISTPSIEQTIQILKILGE